MIVFGFSGYLPATPSTRKNVCVHCAGLDGGRMPDVRIAGRIYVDGRQWFGWGTAFSRGAPWRQAEARRRVSAKNPRQERRWAALVLVALLATYPQVLPNRFGGLLLKGLHREARPANCFTGRATHRPISWGLSIFRDGLTVLDRRCFRLADNTSRECWGTTCNRRGRKRFWKHRAGNGNRRTDFVDSNEHCRAGITAWRWFVS